MPLKATLKLYSPTAAQLRAHQSPHHYNVIRFGRQSGKSTYGTNKLLDKAWKKKRGMFWYIGPTYRLAEQMHDRTKWALGKQGALKDKSDSELMIELKSEGRIFYKSGDNPGSLLGETLDGAVIDECREQDPDIWPHVVMPMLGTTNGWCDFLSTPNGFDWFYDLDQKSKTNPEWGSFHAPSWSNPLWTEGMLAEARASMSPDMYAQEIEAEFRDLGAGAVYCTFGEHNILEKSPFALGTDEISRHLPILIGMDFNLSPMCWILGQHRNRQFYWHDEIALDRTHTAEAADVLIEKVKHHKAGVIIIGDASGKASQRAAAGQSDYDIIKSRFKLAGITYSDKTPDANPSIKDRVNTVNSLFKSADGVVSKWFHPRCKVAIKDARRRAWKTGAATLAFENKDPTIGHMSDAFGYPACVLAPIKPIGSIGKLRVISRSF